MGGVCVLAGMRVSMLMVASSIYNIYYLLIAVVLVMVTIYSIQVVCY